MRMCILSVVEREKVPFTTTSFIPCFPSPPSPHLTKASSKYGVYHSRKMQVEINCNSQVDNERVQKEENERDHQASPSRIHFFFLFMLARRSRLAEVCFSSSGQLFGKCALRSCKTRQEKEFLHHFSFLSLPRQQRTLPIILMSVMDYAEVACTLHSRRKRNRMGPWDCNHDHYSNSSGDP